MPSRWELALVWALIVGGDLFAMLVLFGLLVR